MSNPRFLHLSVVVPLPQRDLLVEICWELGTVGLQEEENPGGVLVQAFFEADTPLAEWRRRVEELALPQGVKLDGATWSVEEHRADEWVQAYRRSFTGFHIGQTYHIHPSWEFPSDRHPINIQIEPGHGFGTGTHESTQLCLMALEAAAPLSGRLLDVGTGSGILAIAAAKLSPLASIFAMDNDPLAVEMARLNLDRNHIRTCGLFAGELAGVRGRFDWVVANLTMEIFRQVAPEIIRLAAGRLLLSGFTVEQTPVVADFFQFGGGFEIVSKPTLNEWQCLLLQPTSSSQ